MQFIRHSKSSLALVLALTLAACASVPSSLETQEGRAAFHATEAAERVTNLQAATIAANATKALPDDAAILIVRFTTSALKVIQTSPNGWAASVQTGYAEMKQQLSPQAKAEPNIAAALATIDALLILVLTGGGR